MEDNPNRPLPHSHTDTANILQCTETAKEQAHTLVFVYVHVCDCSLACVCACVCVDHPRSVSLVIGLVFPQART